MYSLLVNIAEERSGDYLIKDVASTLGSIAACVRRAHGPTVGFLDLTHEQLPEDAEDVRRAVMRLSVGERPAVIGVSFLSTGLRAASAALPVLAQAFPSAIIAAIGYHAATSPCDTIKRFPMVDVVIPSNVEPSFVALVDKVKEGTFKKGAFCHQPGRTWVSDQPGRVQQDLDWLPLFPWDMFHSYIKDSHQPPVIVSSRGCPYGCTFCGASQWLEKRWRAMSPRRMIEEVEHAISCLQPSELYFWDELFTFDRQRVLDFCALTESVAHMPRWGCQTRADAIDPEMLTLMAQSGCHLVGYGVESVDDGIRNGLYHKELEMSTIIEAIEATNRRGMESTVCLLLGPFDSRKSLGQTAEFISSVRPYYAYLMRLHIYEGMKLLPLLEQEGLVTCDSYGQKDWLPRDKGMVAVLSEADDAERWSMEIWDGCKHWASSTRWRDQFFQKLRDFQVEYLADLARGKDTVRARDHFTSSIEALAAKASKGPQ